MRFTYIFTLKRFPLRMQLNFPEMSREIILVSLLSLSIKMSRLKF